jgi:hypothetical protein
MDNNAKFFNFAMKFEIVMDVKTTNATKSEINRYHSLVL